MEPSLIIGPLVLTLQFASKLNLARNFLQESLLDSVPYAEDATLLIKKTLEPS